MRAVYNVNIQWHSQKGVTGNKHFRFETTSDLKSEREKIISDHCIKTINADFVDYCYECSVYDDFGKLLYFDSSSEFLAGDNARLFRDRIYLVKNTEEEIEL